MLAVSGAPQDAAALTDALSGLLDAISIMPTDNPAVSKQLFGSAGACTGWSFRDVGGTTGANQEKSSSTLAGAAISAVLTDTAGEQTYITGFDVTLGVGAAAAPVVVQVTGIANPLNYDMEVSTTAASTLSIRFPQPLPGAAITVSVPAAGGIAAQNAVTAYGTDSASTGGVIDLYSGHDATGLLLATITVAAGGSVVQSWSGPLALPFDGGLFMQVVSGSVKGSVYAYVL